MQQMLRILVVFMAIGLPMLDITSASTASRSTTVEITTQTTHTRPTTTQTTHTRPTTTQTTASPVTTPAPSPPAPANPERGNFSNNCLSVKGKFQFSVEYAIPGGKQTAVISLPKDATVANSNCSDLIHFPLNFKVQGLVGNFDFTMIFNRTATDIVMSGAEFMYNLTRDHFPGAVDVDKEMTATNHTMSLNQFNKDNYWMCNANITVTVDTKVSYTVSELDVAAVGSKRSSAQQCPDDAVVSYTVPIAVGAALAGLVLIILIAYVIGRTRNKKGYESV